MILNLWGLRRLIDARKVISRLIRERVRYQEKNPKIDDSGDDFMRRYRELLEGFEIDRKVLGERGSDEAK